MEIIPRGLPDWELRQWVLFFYVGAVCDALILFECWLWSDDIMNLYRIVKRWWVKKR